jgi:hypothetical protein
MPLRRCDVYEQAERFIFKIFLLLLSIFAAVKVLRLEWPF